MTDKQFWQKLDRITNKKQTLNIENPIVTMEVENYGTVNASVSTTEPRLSATSLSDGIMVIVFG